MAHTGGSSITRCLEDLRGGDGVAAQPLWDRYYERLARRARSRLFEARCSRAVQDEEDLALSAFDSFCEGLRHGRFPQLEDRDGLWRLLVRITANKAIDRHRGEMRQKRGEGKVAGEADLAAGQSDDERNPLDRIIGKEPSPEFTAMAAEKYRKRVESLGDDTLRRIAERKLEGYTSQEIADRLSCALRTVTLKLELIRKTWASSPGP
jgi:DNA-directed RNA polymerase specialized sigma24 family protein